MREAYTKRQLGPAVRCLSQITFAIRRGKKIAKIFYSNCEAVKKKRKQKWKIDFL